MRTFKCYFDSMRRDGAALKTSPSAYPPARRANLSRRHYQLTDAILFAILFIAFQLLSVRTVDAIVIVHGDISSSTAKYKIQNYSQVNIESNLIETSSEDEYKSFIKKSTTQSTSKSKLLLRKNHLKIYTDYSDTGLDEMGDQKSVANMNDDMDDKDKFSPLRKYTTVVSESVTSSMNDGTSPNRSLHESEEKVINTIKSPISILKEESKDIRMQVNLTDKPKLMNLDVIKENVKNNSYHNDSDIHHVVSDIKSEVKSDLKLINLPDNQTNTPETNTSVTTDRIVINYKPTTNRYNVIKETTTEKTQSLFDFMGRILYEFDLSRTNDRQLDPVGSINRTENDTLSSNVTDDKIYSEIRKIEGLKPEEDYTEEYDLFTDGSKISSTATTVAETSSPFTALWEVAESVAGNVMEMILPKGLRDLMKRMQKQNELLETERLRSREENGGIGQLGRSIIKGVSSGIVEPLVRGVRDIGSLDTDNNFFAGVVNGVTSMANEVMDTFKDRVKAIYPGTLWCGDGHLAGEARSLGVFARTDTCCRRHDACSAHIPAGGTRHNLTNTGIFTRSHCGCDRAFRECLRRLNTPISAQVGFTYFSVLGPQCFRFAHPIVRCVRKTRITGQKCEEYELDYSKPKMWQWFDNETF